MFRARFDLLTTADDGAKRLVRRLPGFRFWKGLLQPRTAFVGTTVSDTHCWPRARIPCAWPRN